MVRRYVVLSVVVASIVAGLILNTKLLQGQTAVATVRTDKSDYAPGEFVTVTGSGFLETETVRLVFHERLDEPFHEDGVLEVVVGPGGTFSDSRYQLETHDAGVSYLLTATGLTSGRVAQVYFTDFSLGSLDQCANGELGSSDSTPCRGTETPSPDAGGEGWVNGNLGQSKSHYSEGESVPYRLAFSGLSIVGTHTVTIEWDTTKSGKHALDYITTFNRTVTNANPCEGVPDCSESSYDTEPIPADSQVTGAGVTPVANQFFRLYGGDITNVSPYGYSHGTGFVGDKSASITISFTTTVANPVLAWGGHIATRQNWGQDSSAVTISGSPFHMRLIGVDNEVVDPTDNGPGGNQDRSLSAEAVIFPASITIIKNAAPNHAQDFAFTTSGGLTPSTFILDDDSGAPGEDSARSNTQLFSGILITAQNGNNYTVAETTVSLWDLTFADPPCTVASVNGGSQSASGNTLSINLREGEDVTCTFTNTRQSASLTLVKSVVGGTAVATDWLLQANGPGGTYGANGGGTYQVDPGQYALSESGGPSSYTASAWVCTGTGTQDDGTHITLANGQSATCTITNTRDQGYLKLTKSFDAKTSGFNGTFDVVYNCGAGDVTVSLAAGASSTEGPFDTGTSCTVTEPNLPTAPTGWTFGTPSIATSPATIVKSTQATPGVTVTVTNTITHDQGYLKIAKSFDAKTSGFADTFAIVYNCGAGNVTVNLAGGANTTVGPFDTGTSCTVSEPTLPTAPSGWSFGTPSIATSPATIVKSTQAAPGTTVTVTNTITRDQGYLKISKSFNANGSGFNGTFAIVYNCGAGNVTVNLAGGANTTVGPFDTGTSCTVTEPNLPTAPTGWTFGTPSIVTSPATIVKSTLAYPGSTVTVTNTITRDLGSLKIIKSVVGAPAGFTGSFSVDVSCTYGAATTTFNDRIISYPSPGFVTIPNIPTGNVCTVTEDTPTGAPTGYSWGTAVISGTATITKNTESQVTVTNTVTGRAKVIKTKAGGALTQSDAFVFQIRTGASTTQLGTVQQELTATSQNAGVLNFTTVLTPGAHYQLCELVMPGWNTSLAGTLFVPGSIIPPTLPNPNVDNSPVCVDFVAQAGVTTTFTVDNTFPGGLARTIGFWKNWASCAGSNGKQKPVLDQTLAAAQAISGLVVSAQSGTYAAFSGTIYLRLYATDCAKAVALLNKSTTNNGKKMASDPAFNLAAQLVAAELNFVAGAGQNGTAINAVNQAVVLLGKYAFNGAGYTGKISNADANTMNSLATTLDNYNNNRP